MACFRQAVPAPTTARPCQPQRAFQNVPPQTLTKLKMQHNCGDVLPQKCPQGPMQQGKTSHSSQRLTLPLGLPPCPSSVFPRGQQL